MFQNTLTALGLRIAGQTQQWDREQVVTGSLHLVNKYKKTLIIQTMNKK